jgi:hypothetical protein
MKTKLDFVTNSSSSSFIFTDKDLTIREATIQMLDLVVKEYIEYFGGTAKKYSWLASAKRKLKVVEPNINIVFPWSTNYETFLYRDSSGNIRVDTCNNHHWEDLPFDIREICDFDDEYKKSLSQNFFDLQKGKIKTRVQRQIDEWKKYSKLYPNSDNNYVENVIKELEEEAKKYEKKT